MAAQRYPYFVSVPTRWMDGDVHGHVGSTVCYAYFDTAICRYLLSHANADIADGPVVPFTIENACRFGEPLFFPEVVRVGLRVARLGRSSVHYEIALFGGRRRRPAAEGRFVDVFVDRRTRRAAPIPPAIRAALQRLLAADKSA